MPELEYFLVAEGHSIDRDSNSISIFNVYTERRFANFPVKIPRLVFISCWIASEQELQDKNDLQAAIRITLPDQKVLGPFNTNFSCDVALQHLLLEYEDLQVAQPGIVMIELLLNGQRVARHRIAMLELG